MSPYENGQAFIPKAIAISVKKSGKIIEFIQDANYGLEDYFTYNTSAEDYLTEYFRDSIENEGITIDEFFQRHRIDAECIVECTISNEDNADTCIMYPDDLRRTYCQKNTMLEN